MRHQSLSEHFRREFTRFAWRFANMHAAFETVGESPLPSSAGVNLRFDHEIDPLRAWGVAGFGDISQLARHLLRFFRR